MNCLQQHTSCLQLLKFMELVKFVDKNMNDFFCNYMLINYFHGFSPFIFKKKCLTY